MPRMLDRRVFSLIVLLGPILGCSPVFSSSAHDPNQNNVQSLLENAVSKNEPGKGSGLLSIALFDPASKRQCARSAFVTGRLAGTESPVVQKATPYGIASVTKAFVATLSLIYVDRKRLNLDSKVTDLFEDQSWILEPIRNRRFRRNLDSVTIRQLLSHRSGLPDYWDNSTFFNAWRRDKGKYWTQNELLRWAGGMSPECAAGKCFKYSDTNYLIMGMILERKFGDKLHTLLAKEVFRPLNMKCSWMFFEEGKPKGCGPVAHSFEGRLDVTKNRMQSADWAGGGIYSTLKDQTTFFGDLFFGGKLLSEKSRKEMLSWNRADYGLGVYKMQLGEDMTLIGHEGFHNAFAFLWKEYNVIFAGTLNQEDNSAHHKLLEPVMRRLKQGRSSWFEKSRQKCFAE